MSAEELANQIADELAARRLGHEVSPLVDEDVRSGGFFFDIAHNGRTFEVLVVER